jgi:hypothetical protein
MRCTRRFQTLAVIFFLSPWGSQQSSKAPRSETISLCQLTRNWKKYDHRTVRIEAVYATGNETSEVYDTGCASEEYSAWAEFPTTAQRATSGEIMGKLHTLLGLNSRARIIVMGEFDGPKKVDIPPNTPPKIADVIRSVNSRYGHQDHWNFQFVFSKVEMVEPVPKDAPWPHTPGQGQQ